MKLNKLKMPMEGKDKKKPSESEFDLSELELSEEEPSEELSSELPPPSDEAMPESDQLADVDDELLIAEIRKRGLEKQLQDQPVEEESMVDSEESDESKYI